MVPFVVLQQTKKMGNQQQSNRLSPLTKVDDYIHTSLAVEYGSELAIVAIIIRELSGHGLDTKDTRVVAALFAVASAIMYLWGFLLALSEVLHIFDETRNFFKAIFILNLLLVNVAIFYLLSLLIQTI